jgi:nicotinamidase-related amidase
MTVREMRSTSQIWGELLTDEDREVLTTAGYGNGIGCGERPALLVVDVTYGFCGARGLERQEAAEGYPGACGPAAWEAVAVTSELQAAARSAGVPVVFTRPVERDGGTVGARWSEKNLRMATSPADHRVIVTEVAPEPDELVLEKDGPSAFFGTSLVGWLSQLEIDTVIVCGGTTSGCVRATVVDAFSHGLRVLVPWDATFDRIDASHRIGLFDMNLKYADVLTSGEIINVVESRRSTVGASAKPETPKAHR